MFRTQPSETEIRKPRMAFRPYPERPMEFPLRLPDGHVVDAGVAVVHDALGIEFPVLVPVGAKPVSGIIVPLVREADRDPAPWNAHSSLISR